MLKVRLHLILPPQPGSGNYGQQPQHQRWSRSAVDDYASSSTMGYHGVDIVFFMMKAVSPGGC